jgi:hypothetical protein
MSHKICYVGNMSIRLEPAASAGSVPVIPATPRPSSVSGAVEIAVQIFSRHSFICVKALFPMSYADSAETHAC